MGTLEIKNRIHTAINGMPPEKLDAVLSFLDDLQRSSEDETAKALEPLIRRVIREKLERITKEKPDTFYLDPKMPLYQDMEELRLRKNQGEIKLLKQGYAKDEYFKLLDDRVDNPAEIYAQIEDKTLCSWEKTGKH